MTYLHIYMKRVTINNNISMIQCNIFVLYNNTKFLLYILILNFYDSNAKLLQ